MRLTETSFEDADALKLGLQVVKLALLNDANAGFRRNFAGSPLSLTIFLNLLASGAKGHVLDQFLTALGSKSSDELCEKSLNLLSLANSTEDSSNNDEGPFLLMNSGMWVDQRFSVKPAFQDVLNRIYKTEVRFLDFQNKGSEVAEEVNSWVEKKTKGLIKKIISEEVDANRLVVIVNALYFKGVWERQFDTELTKDDKFYLLNGEDVQVPFMCEYSQQHFYNSYEDFKLIKLPYRSGNDKTRFFMYIFLPHERNGLRKLIDHFDSNPDFLNQKYKLYQQCVHNLKIPKFKFSCEFTASNYMVDLGFGNPSLSTLEILETNGEDRWIGAYHRSYIEVNEEGTEAAAVESDEDVGCCLESYSPRPQLNFIADHPFMFMVREDASNVPFFFGAVLNPLQ